jgi:site-specific recombinase XerD
MATFKPVVRTKHEFNAVYIRITTKNKVDYIKTPISIHKSGVEKGEIVDYAVLANCYIKIKEYNDKLMAVNIERWTASDIKRYLLEDRAEISFTEFARRFILKMKLAGRIKSSRNYQTAVHSLLNFCGKSELKFSDITSRMIRDWIEFLSDTNRAKNLYPRAIFKIFNDGCKEYNDYDRNIVRIVNQPFKVIEIPCSETPEKRVTDAETIQKILSVAPAMPREDLAHDVVLLVIYLAGINTVDLYNLPVDAVNGDYLCYNRSKTKGKRRDKAFFKIRILDRIKPLFDKYKGSESLFCFSEMYYDSDSFSQNVNKGLKSLCGKAEVPGITVYWLRHTWATIARNKCGASIEDVAFCLNHSSAHRVTEDYLDKDFSIVDKYNERVIRYLF